MGALLEGLAAGYGIAIPVGAVAVLIVNTALGCGFRIGLMAGAGAATADFLYAILASAAGSALTAVLEPIAVPMRLLGGLTLIGIACSGLWRGLKDSGVKDGTARGCAPLRTYFQFIGITIINPLTIVYFTAFILGRRTPAMGFPLSADLLFILGVALSSLSWQALLALVGGVAGRHLSHRFQLLAVVVGNLLVVGLGARILVIAIFR